MSGEYEIGYGKPPKSGQFKKGQTGNPRGRPKGTQDLKADLVEELQEKILIKEDGTKKSVSKQRAALKALTMRALNAEYKAIALLLNLCLKLIPDQDEGGGEPQCTAADQEILEKFKEKVLLEDMKKKGETDVE